MHDYALMMGNACLQTANPLQQQGVTEVNNNMLIIIRILYYVYSIT